MGCDAPLPLALQAKLAGKRIERCPQFYLERASEWLREAFEVHSWVAKGFLPGPGTWLDQPNKIIEICALIDHLYGLKADHERKRIIDQAPPKR